MNEGYYSARYFEVSWNFVRNPVCKNNIAKIKQACDNGGIAGYTNCTIDVEYTCTGSIGSG